MYIKNWIVVIFVIFLIASMTMNGWILYSLKTEQSNTDWAMSYVKDRTMSLKLGLLVQFVDNHQGEWEDIKFRRGLLDLMNEANNGISIAYNMTTMENGDYATKEEANLHKMFLIFDKYHIAASNLYKEYNQENFDIIKELITRLKEAKWGTNSNLPSYSQYQYSKYFSEQVQTFLNFNSKLNE